MANVTGIAILGSNSVFFLKMDFAIKMDFCDQTGVFPKNFVFPLLFDQTHFN
jgi:hypothetical protein